MREFTTWNTMDYLVQLAKSCRHPQVSWRWASRKPLTGGVSVIWKHALNLHLCVWRCLWIWPQRRTSFIKLKPICTCLTLSPNLFKQIYEFSTEILGSIKYFPIFLVSTINFSIPFTDPIWDAKTDRIGANSWNLCDMGFEPLGHISALN